jgi:hypothetical protein
MTNTDAYFTDERAGDGWRCCSATAASGSPSLTTESVDLSVHSPPFASLYTYSPSPRDLGNSASDEEFLEHFGS